MAGAKGYKAQQFIDAIPGTAGIVTAIAKKVGCAWNTAKKYIDNYPTVNRAYVDECERVLDKAESVVLTAIVEDSDIQTAKWYLTMKGRGRGYAQTQRQEITGKDGDKVKIKVSLDDVLTALPGDFGDAVRQALAETLPQK